MLKQIFFQSDWYLHLLSALAVWGIAYLVETKLLKRKFSSKKILFLLLIANLIERFVLVLFKAIKPASVQCISARQEVQVYLTRLFATEVARRGPPVIAAI